MIETEEEEQTMYQTNQTTTDSCSYNINLISNKSTINYLAIGRATE